MFMTTRDTGERRRSKGYANNLNAKSSKTSLLSVFTVASAGSGDSNSTVTQTTYNRSQHKRRRRSREVRHGTHDSHVRTRNKNESVDVFDFLVNENTSKESFKLNDQPTRDHVLSDDESIGHDLDRSDESDDGDDLAEREECEYIGQVVYEDEGASAHQHVDKASRLSKHEDFNTPPRQEYEEHHDDFDRASPIPGIVVHADDSDPEIYYRSMSDSGISMGSCSIDASIMSLPARLPVLAEEPPSRPTSQPRLGNELAVIDPRYLWNTSPVPFHDGYIPPPAPAPPPIMYEMQTYPPYPPYPPYTPYGTPPPPPLPEEEIRGPSITIREPSHQEIKPKCFRSFTKMSTRLILQIQDDIAELEGELSVLDAELDVIESDSSSDDESYPRPGTTRHMLKARETEIYDELQFKLDQYSSSLGRMHKMEKISQPAVKSDLTKHHQWLESRISPSFRARHLVGNDLRTFSTTKAPEVVVPVGQDTQFMAYSALINTLLPLIAFKIVGSVLSRLILLVIIVITGVTRSSYDTAGVDKERR